MKKIILICVLLISACSDGTEVSDQAMDSPRAKELMIILDNLDLHFAKILSSLESNDVKSEVKEKILCTEFPELYKSKYIPATLEYQSLTTQSITKDELLNDLKNITTGYSKKLNIHCD